MPPPQNEEELIYSKGKPLSLIDRAALRNRRKIHAILSKLVELDKLESVLDVGVTADQAYVCSNYFENHYPHKERIVALSDQPAGWLEGIYQGLRFVQADGRHLPFGDSSFDLVYSSAVWEHVGPGDKQLLFLKECLRVARRYVFLTTPNRWHPLELHTGLPFFHWLPKSLCRKFPNLLSYAGMVAEGKLNLLSGKDIKEMMARLSNPGSYCLCAANFLGLPSNLLLFIDETMEKKRKSK